MKDSDDDVSEISIFELIKTFFRVCFQLNFEENGHLNGDDNESDEDNSS